MKPKAPFIFTVEGKGAFPLDMLRYDQCWPHKSKDAEQLKLRGYTSSINYQTTAKIELMSNTRPPTEGRWESFGWKVVS